MSQEKIPVEYRPLSPLAYFGYNILFLIPGLGLILIIVYSFSNSNIHRRNFARSYALVYVIGVILLLVLIFTGGLNTGLNWLINKIGK